MGYSAAMATSDPTVPAGPGGPGGSTSAWRLQLLGLLLFLFIPLVLFLFVRHPAPVGVSLAAGVVLMLGHRFLARPYMGRALAAKCLWCNRALSSGAAGSEPLELATGAGPLTARCCPEHRAPAARFFAFLDTWRLALRAGIFLPLLLLLLSLAAVAGGRSDLPLPGITAVFKLAVGLTVNLAALGPLVGREKGTPTVPFPVHNFFLLGVRNLLWIFRLVGIWWIVQGVLYFLGR